MSMWYMSKNYRVYIDLEPNRFCALKDVNELFFGGDDFNHKNLNKIIA